MPVGMAVYTGPVYTGPIYTEHLPPVSLVIRKDVLLYFEDNERTLVEDNELTLVYALPAVQHVGVRWYTKHFEVFHSNWLGAYLNASECRWSNFSYYRT